MNSKPKGKNIKKGRAMGITLPESPRALPPNANLFITVLKYLTEWILKSNKD